MKFTLDYLSTHFFQDVRQALGQLAHHQLRSALTLLGMVFGVGAVIAMLAVSEGGRIEAMKMIEGMGVHNIILEETNPGGDPREVRAQSAGLSVSDAIAISETMPFVEQWAAVKRVNSWNLFSPQGQSWARVLAVSPSYFELSGLEIADGTLFTSEDDVQYQQKVVLGSTAAQHLFPKGDPVGQRLKVNYVWFEVIGVLRDRQLSGEEFQGERVGGESETVFMPLQTGLRRMRHDSFSSEISSLKLKIRADLPTTTASTAVAHLIDRRHGGIQDTRMVIPARLLAQQRETQRIFTIVMSAVAGISLLVGGIGIMNIMLASVLERKSEIGLLRAVGATEHDVVRTFLIETTVIALIGALAGILIGVVLAYIIGGFANWEVAWSLPVIALAVIVCVAIAVCFGVYPAFAAARLDPVAALQAE